jgi:uncharacterized protein (DUF885 family)
VIREFAGFPIGARPRHTFHDAVLKNRALPLKVLEQNVEEWIK